ncbi:prepilin-type N-terminal cleavage/methylation domain-containing protein, partial [Sulfurimonas sp. SAG-AH-194-C21]
MKKAFTMIELVFVIVVIGILVATILPSTKTNPLKEAAVQLVSHIKYTQHLAMVDDKFDSSRVDSADNIIWHKDRWQIVFTSSIYSDNGEAYTIFSDTQGNAVTRGDAQKSEVARNPQNSNQIMTGGYSVTAALDYRNSSFEGMKKLNIGKSYGVTSVTFGSACNSGKRISFDHLGRPFQGDQSSMTGAYTAGTQRLIVADCIITLGNGPDSVS